LIFFVALNSYATENCTSYSILKSLREEVSLTTTLAGSVADFDQRIDLFLELYEESNRNFIFPLVALHGAKWAKDYLTKNDYRLFLMSYQTLGLIAYKEINKLKILSYELKRINREVFIDVVSKYKTATKKIECNEKLKVLGFNQALIDSIKLSLSTTELSNTQKLAIYKEMLLYEQQKNVAPKIKELAKRLNFNLVERNLFLRPKVRFAYFPEGIKFKFKNFFDTEERIAHALAAAKLALQVGDEKVINSIY